MKAGGDTGRHGAWLFALALAIRLVDVGFVEYPRLRDQGPAVAWETERAARSVARSGAICDVFGDDTGPTAHVSPAYPWLVGLIYRLVGPDVVRRTVAREVLSSMIVASAVGLLPRVARRTGLRPGSGLAAGLVMAIVPAYLGMEVTGDWEQPLAALALLIVVLDAADPRPRGGWRSARTGLWLGGSALLSPTVAMAGVLMGLSRLVSEPSAWKTVARGLAIEAAVMAAVLAPWAVRNAREVGGFIPLRSNLGLELYVGNHDDAIGFIGEPDTRRHPMTSEAERAEYRRLGERRYMADRLRSSLAWIAGHPGRFGRLTLRRVGYFWFPDRTFWLGNGCVGRWAVVAVTAYGWLVSAMALGGLAVLLRTPRRSSVPPYEGGIEGGYGPCQAVREETPSNSPLLRGRVCLDAPRGRNPFLLYASALFGASAIYYVLHVMPRYRYPVYPLTLLLAAHFVLSVARPTRRAAPDGGDGP